MRRILLCQPTIFMFALLLAFHAGAQVGKLDHRFAAHGLFSAAIHNGGDTVRDIALYPSSSVAHAGKIVLAGEYYDTGKGYSVIPVMRLNANGTIDTSFNGTGIATIDFGASQVNSLRGLVIQSDDKIVVLVEHRIPAAPNSQLAMARLNADGTLDTGFADNGILIATPGGAATYWYNLVITKEGKFVVCGNTGNYDSCIAIVAADGKSNNLYTVNMTALVGGSSWQEMFYGVSVDDGDAGSQNIYATGTVCNATNDGYIGSVAKLNSAGAIVWQKTFNYGSPGSSGADIKVHDFGGTVGEKLVVGGGSGGTLYCNFDNFGLAMFNPSDGSFYTTFGGSGSVVAAFGNSVSYERIAIQSDDKIIVGGNAWNFACARYNLDGTLDTTFDDNGYSLFEVPTWGDPKEYVLNDAGEIVLACTTYNDDCSVYYYSAVILHTADKAMEHVATDTSQITADLDRRGQGVMMKLLVCVDGSSAPLDAESITFNTNGSTDAAADIFFATVYYTGASGTFSPSTVYGMVPDPNGAFTVTGTQPLTHGDNYFWLVYGLNTDATTDHVVDAECSELSLSGQTVNPATVAPAGSRKILEWTYPSISGDGSTDYLSRVQLGDIDNVSGAALASGYSDYTAESTSVTAGATTPFSCNVASAWWGDGYTEFVVAWCDWNQDYDFDDAGEEYIITETATAEGPHTADVAVPAGALAGDTRMRVVVAYTDVFTPDAYPSSGDIQIGEAEDYTLNVIVKTTPTVNEWPAASAITYGQTLESSSLSGGSATVAGTFAFSSPTTGPNAGTYSAAVTFTPTDTAAYNTVSSNVDVQVNKATPTVTWPKASGITYGQALSASSFSGESASVAGAFAFTSPATIPDSGTYSASVTFTPTDTANYNTVDGNVNVSVGKATPTVTEWPSASAIVLGQTLASSTLTGGSASVAGSFAFTDSTTAPAAGAYSAAVTFTPGNTTNYKTVAGNVNVTVNQPTITVTSPTGADAWRPRSVQTITWTSEYLVGDIKIKLFKGGALAAWVTGSSPNDGEFQWRVPADLVPASNYSIQIYSASDLSIIDNSAQFSIVAPLLKVTSPNGGETWLHNGRRTITWNAHPSAGASVRIKLFKGDALSTWISGGTPNDGQFTWEISPDIETGDDYKIQIYAVADTSVIDTSDSAFSIAESPIELIHPDGTEQFAPGDPVAVTWTGEDIVGADVKIKLFKNGRFNSWITGSTTNDGLFTWRIPPTAEIGDDYKIQIYSVENMEYIDFSDADFSITNTRLRITSPSASTKWIISTPVSITWDAAGILPSADVQLTLYKGGVFSRSIANTTTNSGEHIWMLPFDVEPGDDYFVAINCADTPAVYDVCDVPFTIAAGALRVTYPNGNEQFMPGDPVQVSWSAEGNTGVAFDLQLLIGGVYDSDIATITGATTYQWTVPESLALRNDYAIRVVSKLDPTIADDSNAPFALTDRRLRIIWPNGGQSIAPGSTNFITWDSDGIVGTEVKLKLFANGVFRQWITGRAPNTGSFKWRVPLTTPAGGQYTIQIYSTDLTVRDFSDGQFIIN